MGKIQRSHKIILFDHHWTLVVCHPKERARVRLIDRVPLHRRPRPSMLHRVPERSVPRLCRARAVQVVITCTDNFGRQLTPNDTVTKQNITETE